MSINAYGHKRIFEKVFPSQSISMYQNFQEFPNYNSYVWGEAAKGWGRQACEGQQPSCVQNFASAQPIEEYPPFKSKNGLVWKSDI